MKPDTKLLRTWIEVDRKAIKKNIASIKRVLGPKVKFMAVVKSNAYGHGLSDFAREVATSKVDWLGVDSAVEGLTLRKEGIHTPILVLGYTLPGRVEMALRAGLSLTASHLDALKDIANTAKRLGVQARVHIKVDTGMHRQGFLEGERPALFAFLQKHRREILAEGLYTHFAAAKDPKDRKYTTIQIKEFDKWVEAMRAAGFSPIMHASATGGAMIFPEAHYDMVRIGIGLYGLYPSVQVRTHAHKRIPLAPPLAWKGIVSEIKKLPKGSYIGYDLTEHLKRASIIAICPVGYWHGYPRALSGKGSVSIRGKKVCVLGRVSMDMLVLDVTNVPGVKIGDEVVLLGGTGKGQVDIADTAALAGTTGYELLTRLNPRMKRFYI